MILTLNKPINISLQSKPLTVVDGFPTHSGAWDIIYFVRMDNEGAAGDIYRLGKVVDIVTEGEMLSSELVSDGSFDSTLNMGKNSTSSFWSTENQWEVISGVPTVTADNASTSRLSQFYNTNPLVPKYKETGNNYIVSGNTYQVSFDVIAVGGSSSNIRVSGYTQPDADIFDETTPLGTKTVKFTATSDGLKIHASANANGWKIDNISVKQVYPATDTTYVVRVEPDATAQTPDVGDFIFFGKDNEIGVAGVTGYYTTVEMKNDSINYAELFAVSSEITISSK